MAYIDATSNVLIVGSEFTIKDGCLLMFDYIKNKRENKKEIEGICDAIESFINDPHKYGFDYFLEWFDNEDEYHIHVRERYRRDCEITFDSIVIVGIRIDSDNIGDCADGDMKLETLVSEQKMIETIEKAKHFLKKDVTIFIEATTCG